jgi:hypothetical protein
MSLLVGLSAENELRLGATTSCGIKHDSGNEAIARFRRLIFRNILVII